MKREPKYWYWGNRGRHQDAATQLQKQIPDQGEVPDADANPALEEFRIASNCYYDLYNNGLCNREAEFHAVFGRRFKDITEEAAHGSLTLGMMMRVERRMDRFVLAAAKEQGISHA